MMDVTLPAERWETLGARKMAVKNQTAVQKTTKHFDQYTEVSAHGDPKKNKRKDIRKEKRRNASTWEVSRENKMCKHEYSMLRKLERLQKFREKSKHVRKQMSHTKHLESKRKKVVSSEKTLKMRGRVDIFIFVIELMSWKVFVNN